ncbi:MAG: hypothetical protein IKW96_14355 [Ruminococcus sp.]|uniref:hypothetical protein n=1 Tax=Ruminococcus sp. TaxID=41978 RepID=UPI0025F4E278|nr:hypothetical protein [Ruminococcus sp.]MBR5684432.1 hypothetical protein [Ruminococcus sp.]
MKKLIAIVCFSALVLAGCGNTVNSGNSSNNTTTAANTTAAVTEEAATETAETTTEIAAETTEAAEAETEVTTHEENVSAGSRMDMYPAVYKEKIRSVFEQTENEHDGMASIEYAFRDLDADGIPELLLKYGSCEADYQIHIYRYDEECELKDLGVFGGGHTSFCYDENTGNFVLLWGHMGAASIIYYEWENGTLVSKDSYDFSLDEQTPSYDTVLDEKGIRYMDFVSAHKFLLDGDIKSWVYHGDGSPEEYDGLYLDYIG